MAKRKTRNSIGPWIMMGVGSLVILGAVIWKTLDVVQGVEPTPATADTTSNSYIPYPDVNRILLEPAKEAFDNGTAIIVDVRDAEYFTESHIAGAINIPYGEIESRLDELDPLQHYILYCT